MAILKQNRRYLIIVLILVIGAIFLAGAPAYAAAEPPQDLYELAADLTESLSVDEVWLTGDTLHIAVTDNISGESQTLELNLADYAHNGDEYVTVQATNADGNTSNSIQFKNPYYVPQEDNAPNEDGTTTSPSGTTESSVPDSEKPFTPDGSGTVIDNAESGDGKEFFTVDTVDGNTFYLIIDRQRTADNVYLLNAVTESDLASMAKPGDGTAASAIPTTEPAAGPATPEISAEPSPEPAPEPSIPEKSGGNTGTIAFIVIAVVVVGGAGYYFKIVRPKQNSTSESDYEQEDDFDDDEQLDVETDGDEEGDDE